MTDLELSWLPVSSGVSLAPYPNVAFIISSSDLLSSLIVTLHSHTCFQSSCMGNSFLQKLHVLLELI